MTQSLEAAARALLAKLKITEANSRPIYEYAFVHGVKYAGENYEPEVMALEAALNAIPADAEPVVEFAHAYGLFSQGEDGRYHLQFIDGNVAVAHKLHGEVLKHPAVKTVNGAGFKVLPIMVKPTTSFHMSKERLRELILSDTHDIDGDETVAAQAPVHGLRYTQSDVDRMLAMRDARHADALAVLAELVACKDCQSRGWFNETKEEIARKNKAYIEARRVIAANGGRG